MSKKILCSLLSFVLAFSMCGFDFAERDGVITKAHVYKVLPGSDEWKQMTAEERYASCFISAEEVSRMTTKALLETIINYPYLCDLYAYGSFEDGVKYVSMYFPALVEFLTRTDANIVLQQSVNKIDTLDNENSLELEDFVVIDLLSYIEGLEEDPVPDAEISATNATVYTPNGTAVKVVKDKTWVSHLTTKARADAATQRYTEAYPNVVVAQTMSDPAYNCHSHAWYSGALNNKYWMDDPSAYMKDGSYRSSTAKAGNVITYHDSKNSSAIHSGVCTSDGRVVSKWGYCGRMLHNKEDCPYYKASLLTTTTLKYWEKN